MIIRYVAGIETIAMIPEKQIMAEELYYSQWKICHPPKNMKGARIFFILEHAQLGYSSKQS